MAALGFCDTHDRMDHWCDFLTHRKIDSFYRLRRGVFDVPLGSKKEWILPMTPAIPFGFLFLVMLGGKLYPKETALILIAAGTLAFIILRGGNLLALICR